MMDNQQDDELNIQPDAEPLTPEEMEKFLSRVRAEGRSLTSEEQYALFGPPKAPEKNTPPPETVEEMEAAKLTSAQLDQLTTDFFGDSEFGAEPALSLIQGIIFDFDSTLAYLPKPLSQLMEEGARNAEEYMRSTGMTLLPEEFWEKIIEARQFAHEKSAEEKEEHIADDAMSFLLQFFGYPASKMDPEVLRRTVDIFYAPEMMAWTIRPEAPTVLKHLADEGYKIALVSNYNCDRVFQRTVDYLGLRPHLDIVLSSASVEHRKPDEKLFQIVLDRWDALPHEVIIVGDSLEEDIQGAVNLGAFSVQTQEVTSEQVRFDNQQLADQIQADAKIERLSELPDIVAQWSR